MKSRKLAFFTMLFIAAASVAVAVSVMVSEDAFAKDGRYSGDSTSQAAAVSNECLNPIFDSNTIDNAVGVGNCGGTVSQQDESGSASAPVTHQIADPRIELQRATTTQPPPTTTPPTSTLLVQKICILTTEVAEDFQNCPSGYEFDIVVQGTDPDNPPIPSTFTFQTDDQGDLLSQLVSMGAGTYTITEENVRTPNDPLFEAHPVFTGDCKQSSPGSNIATGTITAGESQTCIITNLITE